MTNVTVQGRTFTKCIRVAKLKEESTDTGEQCPPSTYVTNSDTEEICLAIISDFESTLKQDNPDLSHSLFLAVKNEFQIPKCVCTTIKPELLPYPAVYDVDGCSEFVSHYLDFEPLEDPCKPPSCLPSPSQVLTWGVGDCFDFSVLLASFLIGSGYDAYVVFGIAPKWICERDTSTLSFSIKQAQQEVPGNQLKSVEKVIEDMKGLKKEHGGCKDEGNTEIINFNESNDKEIDDLHGSRIHCWVLVKAGLRCPPGTTDFFVEPSTGERYSCQDANPYIQIYALWNTRNYWINKTGEVLPSKINIDCSDQWDAVFYNSSLMPRYEYRRKSFDPPFSWVKNLSISKESFSFRYPPNGQRIILRKKVKVEHFSEGIHKQGLLKRVTTFGNTDMTDVYHCEEYFGATRADHLVRRIRLYNDHTIHEDYSPRHSYSLSEWIEICGNRRIIKFRERGRSDGLVSHEELFGEVLVHSYSGRRDGLYERSSFLKGLIDGTKEKSKGQFIISTTDGNQNANVTKIIEKYKSPVRSNECYIVARIFLLDEKKIITKYMKKNGSIDREEVIYSNKRNHEPIAPDNDYYENQHAMMNAEKTAVTALRIINQEMADLVRMRKREEDVLRVNFSSKEDTNSSGVEKPVEPSFSSDNDCRPRHLDYLSPFLLHVQDVENISKEEAVQIKVACLATCKDRLLQRADIMQNRIHEESAKLAEIQAKYQRDDDKTEKNKEAFEKASSELTFRIKILERRLQDHEDASIEKYKALETKLMCDLGPT